jgi:hypothetical protein
MPTILMEKGIFTKKDFWEVVRGVNKEMENRRNKR